MSSENQSLIRPATREDLPRLANLIHFEAYTHRHLDYRPPLDWVGQDPFLLLEDRQGISAVLGCPPSPPSIAWIRLFAVTARSSSKTAWSSLWSRCLEQLISDPRILHIAAIPVHNWFASILKLHRFERTHSVVMMVRDSGTLQEAPIQTDVVVRPMLLQDIQTVHHIDTAAFASIWISSMDYLENAFRQAAIASIAEISGVPVGFQISTSTPFGGHLARIAVLPKHQGIGVGSALLDDLVRQFSLRGTKVISLNTQNNNPTSISLYRRMGFEMTGEEYPVYELPDFRTKG